MVAWMGRNDSVRSGGSCAPVVRSSGYFNDHDRKFFVVGEGYIGIAAWEIQVDEKFA